ncbi:MAG TPA: ABC transporter ATP-binding protein [Accumulibacter sp.]|nr:ABC transporter ATP-binding protein [Accumulibacter sp.]HNN07771.1 ABC transporter ATP-binding protein [Azospira sp.]HNN45456.1 ABC transporter ATP-binding protein [Azospira sp.]
MTPAIHVENLSKIYPRTWRSAPVSAVDDISLSIGVGEAFGFIGPNGAGKSTTIKILTGVLRASAGRAELFGHDVALPIARAGLGYVPENPSVYDFLTPLEILTMGMRLHGVKVGNERRHCMVWLERFGLSAVANKPIRAFSKGMTQRVALAHALAIMPRLLILDEPLSGLDPVGRKDVVDILGEYRSGGGTLFFSSHVLHDVESIADRFGLIHRGKLLTIRSPQEVVADQADRYVLRYRGNAANDGEAPVRAGLHVLEVSAPELPQVIAKIQADGAILQDVRPKASLEAVFFKAIASGNEGAP